MIVRATVERFEAAGQTPDPTRGDIRLEENDIVASVGSHGDSYDNALVESFNGLFKWELIHPHGPRQSPTDVECATLEYIDWFDDRAFPRTGD